MPKYLNSPETIIFDKSRILYGLNLARRSRESYFIICEGYLDVMALHQAGFTNAIAALGTAFTEFHGSLLKRYTREVVLSFDNDGAGIKASLRAITILRDAGISVKVLNMEPYKDPDDFIKSLGADEFKQRIEEAKNSFFYEIDVLKRDYNMDDPEEKTRFFNETAKKLLYFSEELERNFYLDAVAKAYDIDAMLLGKLVNKLGSTFHGKTSSGKKLPYSQAKGRRSKDNGIIKTQKILITWLTEDNSLYDRIKGVLKPEDFADGIYADVAKLVFEEYDNAREVIPAKIISCFESIEDQSEVASIFNAELLGEIQEADRQKALYDTVFRLKEESLDRQSLNAIEKNDTELLQNIIRQKADLKKNIAAIIKQI